MVTLAPMVITEARIVPARPSTTTTGDEEPVKGPQLLLLKQQRDTAPIEGKIGAAMVLRRVQLPKGSSSSEEKTEALAVTIHFDEATQRELDKLLTNVSASRFQATLQYLDADTKYVTQLRTEEQDVALLCPLLPMYVLPSPLVVALDQGTMFSPLMPSGVLLRHLKRLVDAIKLCCPGSEERTQALHTMFLNQQQLLARWFSTSLSAYATSIACPPLSTGVRGHALGALIRQDPVKSEMMARETRELMREYTHRFIHLHEAYLVNNLLEFRSGPDMMMWPDVSVTSLHNLQDYWQFVPKPYRAMFMPIAGRTVPGLAHVVSHSLKRQLRNRMAPHLFARTLPRLQVLATYIQRRREYVALDNPGSAFDHPGEVEDAALKNEGDKTAMKRLLFLAHAQLYLMRYTTTNKQEGGGGDAGEGKDMMLM